MGEGARKQAEMNANMDRQRAIRESRKVVATQPAFKLASRTPSIEPPKLTKRGHPRTKVYEDVAAAEVPDDAYGPQFLTPKERAALRQATEGEQPAGPRIFNSAGVRTISEEAAPRVRHGS